ncbi:MAG TPA: hypothetical protein VIO61_07050 [Anaerolineaceae bacterium]
MSQSRSTPIIRRFWKPATVIGAGGVTMAAWFEEIVIYAEEILTLILLPLMAGVIYLLNLLAFRSRKLDRQNKQKPGE